MFTAAQQTLGLQVTPFHMITLSRRPLFLFTYSSAFPLRYPIFVLPLHSHSSRLPHRCRSPISTHLYKSLNTRKNIELWAETDYMYALLYLVLLSTHLLLLWFTSWFHGEPSHFIYGNRRLGFYSAQWRRNEGIWEAFRKAKGQQMIVYDIGYWCYLWGQPCSWPPEYNRDLIAV
jgi:hypothetical protein